MIELLKIAHAFRASLEAQRDLGLLPQHMSNFPRACCGVTSELLGHYLNSKPSGSEAESVSALRDGTPHIWLVVDSLVVDLTADQFPGRPAVYVGPWDDWYRSWEVDLRGKAQHCTTPTSYDEQAVLARIIEQTGLPSFD
ncbi:hypothetical protein [Pseudomonas sp. Irchel s3a18]|uniref:hypothetical protein n=1 Tax=Pseudomonas sp. Irchel s3a18 TaxID=2009053 RepID=UPI000BA2F269|nr:hypothetical protein [Pseudomonas sp. Irchel s3a18]